MSYQRMTNAGWEVHPGEILKEEFLKPLKLSGYALAKALQVEPQDVNDIVRKKRGISARMALLLGKYFETTPEFWMNLQTSFNLHSEAAKSKDKIDRIRPHSRSRAA